MADAARHGRQRGRRPWSCCWKPRRTGEPYRLVLTDAHMPRIDGFMLAEQIKQDADAGQHVIMMLTSGDRPEDMPRCENWDRRISAQADQAVGTAGGHRVGPGHRGRPSETRSHRPHRRRHLRRLRILLAEDSLVNQKLAVALLEGRATRSPWRTTAAKAVAAVELAAVRPGADGRADAGDGRSGGHGDDPRPRAADRHAICRSSP